MTDSFRYNADARRAAWVNPLPVGYRRQRAVERQERNAALALAPFTVNPVFGPTPVGASRESTHRHATGRLARPTYANYDVRTVVAAALPNVNADTLRKATRIALAVLRGTFTRETPATTPFVPYVPDAPHECDKHCPMGDYSYVGSTLDAVHIAWGARQAPTSGESAWVAAAVAAEREMDALMLPAFKSAAFIGDYSAPLGWRGVDASVRNVNAAPVRHDAEGNLIAPPVTVTRSGRHGGGVRILTERAQSGHPSAVAAREYRARLAASRIVDSERLTARDLAAAGVPLPIVQPD